MFTTLIETETLESLLRDPKLVVVDARYDLADHSAGRAAYLAAHIPGARYADLGTDLSDPPGGGRGRHPLPAIATLVETLSRLGISNESQVVVYDAADGAYASRLWWLLRYLGHDAVAVLNGGFAKWSAEERPVSAVIPVVSPGSFVQHVRDEFAVPVEDVSGVASDPNRHLVDSRAPDRYRGDNETLDPVAGHIPGARNRFFRSNVEPNGTFRDAETLRSEFLALLGDTAPDASAFYCGSGVTACHNLLAMTHAGLPMARLYAGSWSEWCSDPRRPVARGEE